MELLIIFAVVITVIVWAARRGAALDADKPAVLDRLDTEARWQDLAEELREQNREHARKNVRPYR